MLLLAPRYGSDSVKSAFQDSIAQPSASDQKCCSMAAPAAARTAAAPGIPAAVALAPASRTGAANQPPFARSAYRLVKAAIPDAARESVPATPCRCASENTWVIRALMY